MTQGLLIKMIWKKLMLPKNTMAKLITQANVRKHAKISKIVEVGNSMKRTMNASSSRVKLKLRGINRSMIRRRLSPVVKVCHTMLF